MSDSTKQLPFNPYPTIQNTKINTKAFTFTSPDTVTYPVAPLISAKFYTPQEGQLTLKVRATLYINSEVSNAPVVKPITEKGSVLTIYYDYDFSDETPESCDVWYVELDYTSPTVGNITTIESFMVNLDPETSRGTETDVTP
ncbi:hypothetical protein [Flavobacterium cellulosilyticum]|uniref:Uncharacterized protein n=1 Tax=Flavobacterium cellulosilyticum TaxID=2541731 RepID=A0A4R5C7F3_9FLAO|nr:hypothetical protein [Flavobacterium cellulosilyticum]TDD94030.1 hypothetical protein E0F76_18030 [Flavobacterium cellulosilyticum]